MGKPSSEDDKFAYKYDPAHAMQPKSRVLWAAGLLIGTVVLTIAAMLGILRLRPASLASTTAATKMPAANVLIAETYSETALLLIGGGETYEIKLAATTTNTVVVTDLTRGKAEALAAALSPQQDRLAYIRQGAGQRTVAVKDLNNVGSAEVKNDKLLGAQGTKFEPCSWTQVAWSPDGTHLSFFGCSKNASVLIVIRAETELTPIILKNTEKPQSTSRQVFWLTNDSLLYTHLDGSTQQTLVSRIQVGEDNQPISVYEK